MIYFCVSSDTLSISRNVKTLPKLAKAYYAVLNQTTTDHMSYVCHLDAAGFAHLMLTLLEGLRSLDTNTNTMVCTVLDRILTFAHGALLRPRRFGHSTHAEAVALTTLMTGTAAVFQELIRVFLHQLVHEDCKTQWSVSRPLLGLLILYPAMFGAARNDVLAALPQQRQRHAAGCLDALVADIDSTLCAPNRDKFTEHVTVLRRDLSGWPAALAAAAGQQQQRQQQTATDAMT
jgi:exportin-7